MQKNHSANLVLGPVVLTCLAASALVLSYWIFLRTPIQHVSPRAESEIRGMSMLLAGASGLLVAVALMCWWQPRVRHDTGFRARAFRMIAALPPWAVVMPVSLSASWVAARMALTTDPAADYWPAFALWLAAIVLLLVSLLPARSLRLPRFNPRGFALAGFVRSEVTLVVLLTAGALAIRVVDLSGAPLMVHGDEEQIGFEALRAANGEIRNMFAAGWGANPSMGFFIYGAFIKVFGADIVSVRLASAVWGAAAVPLVYLLLREMFGRWPALAGSVFLLGYHFPLHLSRVGINVAWDTPMMAAALYFVFRASRYERSFDFAAAGLISGLALYLYHGTRVVPIVVLAYLVYVGAFRWRFVRANLANFALLGLAFLVAAMPLGTYFVTHQHVFWARLDEASIFQSGWFKQQQDLGRGSAAIFWGQIRHAYGGWFYYTDQSPSALYDVPKPLVQGLAVVPLIAGIIYSLLHVEDRRYALLLIAFAIPTFLGGVLTLGPPTGQRLLGAVPAVVGLIAVGLWQLSERLFGWRPVLGAIIAVVAAAGLAAGDARVYFDAARDDARWGSPINTLASHYIKKLPPETRVYWYGEPQVGGDFAPLSLYGHHDVDVFDAKPESVKPVDQASPAVYMFLAQSETGLPSISSRCPGGTTKTLSVRSSKMLTVYELMQPNTCVPVVGSPDDLANARVLTPSVLPVSDYTVNLRAGVQSGEALPCGMSGNTVWYAFTPTADSILSADTDGSTFDTVLAAYTGVDLESLTLAGCNDDSHDVRSKIELAATGGVTYYFQIGKAAKGRDIAETDSIRFSFSEQPR